MLRASIHRFRPTGLVLLLVAAAAVGELALSAPAAATTREFDCLPANGLMNLNDPDELMRGVVTLTNGVTVRIGTGDVDWSRTELAADSARWLYSLKWVESLTRAYTRTGEAAYLDRAIAIAVDFAKDNPPGGGPDPVDAWYPMYAGQRTTVYACLDALRPGLRAVTDPLRAHATWLADPANDLGDWNQGIDPALGILGAGCRLDHAGWRRTAGERFSRLVSANIDAEGALNEQAPGYARFIYERWGLVADKLDECGEAVPSALIQRRPKLLDFMAWATQPDGTLVQLGDTYRAAPLSVRGTATEYVTTAGRRGTPPSATERIYSAGYVFGRDGWSPFSSSMYYTLRFGPGMAFHGHEDHTSVTLSAFGRPVLVDSGHVGYTWPVRRDHLRSPEAHNVLVVPGEGLRRRRPTALTRTDRGDRWRFYEMRDDIWNGHLRTRGVLADLDGRLLVVQDQASRTSNGIFEQLWHLAPGSRVSVSGRSTAVVRDPSGTVETHLIQVPLPDQSLPRGATTVVSGSTDPLLGWVAEGYGLWEPAPVVRMRRTGTSTRMVTVIVPSRPGATVSAQAISSAGNWYVRITRDGNTRYAGISSGGGMWLTGSPPAASAVVPPPAGAVRVDGDWDGDGRDEPGWFHDGRWGLHDLDTSRTTVLSYGQRGDVPVVGDWDGDGTDTIGVVRGNLWVLRDEYKRGAEDVIMRYGLASDRKVVGDWDGDGTDTLGIVRDGLWVLRNVYKRGADDIVMRYGVTTDVPVGGDWDGDGDDTLGVVRGDTWILRDEYRRGADDLVLRY